MSDEATKREGQWVSQLRHWPKTPTNLRKMFLMLMRLHYSNPLHFGEYQKRLGQMIWDNTKAPALKIDPESAFQKEDVEQLPRIFVGLDHINYQRRVVDDRAYPTDRRDGTERIQVGSTNVRIRHVGSTADESQLMAEMTAGFLMGIGDMMREQVEFYNYTLAAVSNPDPFLQKPTEAYQTLRSDVFLHIEFSAVWMSLVDSHRCKAVLPEEVFLHESGSLLPSTVT